MPDHVSPRRSVQRRVGASEGQKATFRRSILARSLTLVDPWMHPDRVAAFLAVAGEVLDEDITAFVDADVVGAQWSAAQTPDRTLLLLLTLRGVGELGVIDLNFTTEPTRDMLDVLQIANRGRLASFAFFTDPDLLQTHTEAFVRAPTPDNLQAVFARALYGGPLEVQAEALDALKQAFRA